MRYLVARESLEMVEPAIGVDDREGASKGILGDCGDVDAGIACALCELVREVDIHASHMRIWYTLTAGKVSAQGIGRASAELGVSSEHVEQHARVNGGDHAASDGPRRASIVSSALTPRSRIPYAAAIGSSATHSVSA